MKQLQALMIALGLVAGSANLAASDKKEEPATEQKDHKDKDHKDNGKEHHDEKGKHDEKEKKH
jgi:Ni/Co efflux regulator RcnB